MCLLLAGVLVIGLGVFSYRYITDGGDWATFTANKQIYNDKGKMKTGTLYERDSADEQYQRQNDV